MGKKYLEEHEEVEFHALGNAVSTSVIAAENLVRNGYATFQQIKTKTITVQSQRGEGKKAKLFIVLRRHKDFQENMEKFNKIKEENDKIAKEKGEPVEGGATKQ